MGFVDVMKLDECCIIGDRGVLHSSSKSEPELTGDESLDVWLPWV